jgi:hypothetical protein
MTKMTQTRENPQHLHHDEGLRHERTMKPWEQHEKIFVRQKEKMMFVYHRFLGVMPRVETKTHVQKETGFFCYAQQYYFPLVQLVLEPL